MSRRRRFVLFACAICFTALGCSSPNYDPPTLINGFRVLAVKVEPPFVGLQPAEGARSWSASRRVRVSATPGALPLRLGNEGNFECLDPRLQVDLGNDATASLSLLDLFEVFELLPQVIEDKVEPAARGTLAAAIKVALMSPMMSQIDGALSVQLLFQISRRAFGGVCRETPR